MPVDSNGDAIAELQAPKESGTALVTATTGNATAGTYSATATLFFSAVSADSIIQINPSALSAPADGASLTTLDIRVAQGWLTSDRKVDVTTTSGTFDGSATHLTPVADTDGRLSCLLRSPSTTVPALVTVASGGSSRDITIQFTRALPERLLVQASVGFLAASQSSAVSVNVTLLRNVGIPTDRTIVDFVATDGSGNSIGVFSGVTTSTNGTAMASFSVGKTSYRGDVTISVAVAGTTAVASTHVIIVDPLGAPSSQ